VFVAFVREGNVVCAEGGVRVVSLSVVGRGRRLYDVRSVLVLLYTMMRGSLCVCRVGGSRVLVYVLLAGDKDKTVQEKRQECENWYSQSGTVPWVASVGERNLPIFFENSSAKSFSPPSDQCLSTSRTVKTRDFSW